MSASQLVRPNEFGCEPVSVLLGPFVLSVNGFAAQMMVELVEYDEGVSEEVAAEYADSLVF